MGSPADEADEMHGCFVYEQADVPEGMTLSAWRRTKLPARRRAAAGRLRRLRTLFAAAL